MKICQVEITVHVSPIKRLLTLYFATETTKCSQIRAVCCPLQPEISAHARKPFPMSLIHYSFASLILFRVPYTLDLLPYYLSIANGAGGVGLRYF